MINGKTYMTDNYLEANSLLDVPGTCQRVDSEKVLFLRMHSVFSNLHSALFTLDNIRYNCVEQYLQSEKAKLFDDDLCHARIMRETNPFKIKKAGF